MAETQSTKKRAAGKTTKRTARKADTGFTAEEKAAMRERAREIKASGGKGDGESDLLAKVAEMPGPDRVMAEHVHAMVKASAPGLTSRTWYGMPAYEKDGNVLCFFQAASKFKARYAMFGFSDKANLDKGEMWPVYYALAEWTPEVEKKLGTIVKKAVS